MLQSWITCLPRLLGVTHVLCRSQHSYTAIGTAHCVQSPLPQPGGDGFSIEDTSTRALKEGTEVRRVMKGNWSNDRGPVFLKSNLAEKKKKDQQLSTKEWATALNIVGDKKHGQVLFGQMVFVSIVLGEFMTIQADTSRCPGPWLNGACQG